jgi:hypothetical protein|tara:strand:+ start:1803 stop:2015 length:213 start_codon:yes stop_codon:yes gene_type:complete
MTYKADSQEDRIPLFKYVLDLNMPEQRKKKVFNHLYEEYRITHEMYRDVNHFIKGIREEDLRGFATQLLA